MDAGKRKDPRTGRQITISVRLTKREHAEMLDKCRKCEPPTNPTAAVRWLINCWVNESK
jgi:hypothetical protein